MDPRRLRPPRSTLAVLLAGVLALLALAAAWVVVAGPEPAGPDRSVAAAAQGAPAEAAPTGVQTAQKARAQPAAQAPVTDADRAGELRRLLDARAAALAAGDRTRWLAGIDPAATAFRERQARLFDSLRRVPLQGWSWERDGDRVPQLPAARRRELGGDAWLARVVLRYRVPGFDGADVRRVQYLTVVRRPAGTGSAPGALRLAGDTDGPSDGRDLWDLGPVEVARGRASLVIGRTHPDELREIAHLADAAVADVTAVWGRDWARRVVVLVPEDEEEMAALLGRGGPGGNQGAGLDQMAAVTSRQLAPGGSVAPSVDRILLNPGAFRALGELGRDVVLTHEITHVATRAATPPGQPMWLSEGLADYVGFLDADVPAMVAAADLLGRVRAGTAPAALPTAADFDATRGDVAPAYEAAWLACRLLAERYGERSLIRFYRTAGAGGLAAAFTQVLGTTEDAFVADWRASLAELAGEAA
jgi:hypothetical protein